MCGICGVFHLDGSPADVGAVSAMRDALAHRGPDDAGTWTEGPTSLGFRRLAIIDLEGGHQPMVAPDGRAVVVFNGEIYNHPELRSRLETAGVRYRTRSDTETILHLHERLGADSFERLNGMFALALWDRRRKELLLARDPLGVKPLYFSVYERRFWFASELRALLAAGVPAELEPPSVQEYLAYGRVHAPRTIVARVHKLLPGHWLRVTPQGLSFGRYWDLPDGGREIRPLDPREAEERLETALESAVRRQLLSDVPLGAFLSGGVDSSLVAAMMTRLSGRPVPTFTIGFSGARRGLDESRWARTVSRHIGSEHHELILPADVLDRLEDAAPALDEPVADSAILPTALLARFARGSVKAVLTGEGADELFAGYNRYKAAFLSDRLKGLKSWTRRIAAPVARRLGKGPLFERLPHATMGDWRRANAESDPRDIAAACLPEFLEAAGPVGGAAANAPDSETPHSLRESLLHDLRTVLCDSLLMKVDKATMRHSLEARVPFLDKHLVELACRLPSDLKLRRLKGKYVLRRVAARYLPRSVVWRRKHGFIVPWEEWVRRPSNACIDDMLSGSVLEARGIFDMARLREMRRRLAAGVPSGGAAAAGDGADPGLFFRVVVLGLWVESARRKA